MENNLCNVEAPSNNIASPHKPIIQLRDLSVLKAFFDICTSTSIKPASNETRLGHESLMAQPEREFSFESYMPVGVYETLLQLLQ